MAARRATRKSIGAWNTRSICCPRSKSRWWFPTSAPSEVIQTVVRSARTGKIGDGKVFVYDVAEAIRIRNDDRGDGAL